ncbi:beta-phosphoglucomutase hydrolase [Methylocaldum marinum]|uniref:Beta-phosphoglucomutase hydrolase n=1 Tax=Methylocaldum marinum TaxID=1432792 RepID=A0A250KNI8_9GAMM|nr:HAD-IA family hydrolase [Methylocaldum marinum]BBA32531.1 beta-phosphoglucomutase hydrolase [Methylocaldum marinum]
MSTAGAIVTLLPRDYDAVLFDLDGAYLAQRSERHGIEIHSAAVDFVRSLRAQVIGTALVFSGIDASAVLEAAGIAPLFDVRVDRTELKGKPASDALLEAARRLRVKPPRAVVVTDTVAEIEAARAGGFGLVIGVDRLCRSQTLREAGADAVVTGLEDIRVSLEPPSAWVLVYEDFDPAREGIRESLCALGNGYFETRGAMPWARADDIHYPGTYLAGGYNRLQTDIAGRVVENEDLVNFPNWLALEFRIADEDWFDERDVRILSFRQELDLRSGLLLRSLRFEDRRGRRSILAERRLVSLVDMHLGAFELTLTAENWSANVTVRSGIDGRVVNAGAKLYEKFNSRHLEPLSGDVVGEDGVCLEVRTSQSRLHVAQAARTQVFKDGRRIGAPRVTIEEPGYIGQAFGVELKASETLVLEKLAFLYTSRDRAISEWSLAARKATARAERFGGAMADHVRAWRHLWRRFDVRMEPAGRDFRLNAPMMLRLNMFHLLQAVSPNSIDLDIGVPARGWTGEAYQGHIFWDELFIFPFLNFRMPEITRSLLMYRYRRLDEARAAARNAGFQGAMFPWQSGSDGQEETQELNLNPRSQRWVPDNSYLQRHVGSAIAYNVWQYFQVTRDIEFLQFAGAELMLEIARFWAGIACFNEERGRYEIRGVMGPDEFHEAYPDAPTPGLDNNAYTNLMAVWVLCRALDVLDLLPDIRRLELMRELPLTDEETVRWEDISRRMFVPFHGDGIISQFEGYEKLAELDWDGYRKRYGNIQRLELILEAENDTANRYKLSKQADVLMLFYLFSSEELSELFTRLGYPFEFETIPRNVAYYDRRSSHGSTLSRVVHAWVLARSNRPRAMTYFAEALQSDLSDIQQGTTAEGVHLGAMAGTVDLVQRVTTGIEVTADVLRLNPRLPEELEGLDLRIRYRGHTLDLRFTRDTLTVHGREPGIAPIRLGFKDQIHDFAGGSTRVFELGK